MYSINFFFQRSASMSKEQMPPSKSTQKLVSTECCNTSSVKHAKYTTEYRDHVSRMGGLIMKEHLHSRNL